MGRSPALLDRCRDVAVVGVIAVARDVDVRVSVHVLNSKVVRVLIKFRLIAKTLKIHEISPKLEYKSPKSGGISPKF